jgi:hypothetical protein
MRPGCCCYCLTSHSLTFPCLNADVDSVTFIHSFIPTIVVWYSYLPWATFLFIVVVFCSHILNHSWYIHSFCWYIRWYSMLTFTTFILFYYIRILGIRAYSHSLMLMTVHSFCCPIPTRYSHSSTFDLPVHWPCSFMICSFPYHSFCYYIHSFVVLIHKFCSGTNFIPTTFILLEVLPVRYLLRCYIVVLLFWPTDGVLFTFYLPSILLFTILHIPTTWVHSPSFLLLFVPTYVHCSHSCSCSFCSVHSFTFVSYMFILLLPAFAYHCSLLRCIPHCLRCCVPTFLHFLRLHFFSFRFVHFPCSTFVLILFLFILHYIRCSFLLLFILCCYWSSYTVPLVIYIFCLLPFLLLLLLLLLFLLFLLIIPLWFIPTHIHSHSLLLTYHDAPLLHILLFIHFCSHSFIRLIYSITLLLFTFYILFHHVVHLPLFTSLLLEFPTTTCCVPFFYTSSH